MNEMTKFTKPILVFVFVWHLCLLGVSIALLEFGVAGAICGNPGELFPRCLLAGITGGVVYCIRGVYLHFCVLKDWKDRWIVWHLGRPPVSMICGGVCYLFLKAGLLLLSAESVHPDFPPDFSRYVYYVLAFIAGYNVDNFLQRLEEISKAVVGVVESRAAKESEKSQKSDSPTKGDNSR